MRQEKYDDSVALKLSNLIIRLRESFCRDRGLSTELSFLYPLSEMDSRFASNEVIRVRVL